MVCTSALLRHSTDTCKAKFNAVGLGSGFCRMLLGNRGRISHPDFIHNFNNSLRDPDHPRLLLSKHTTVSGTPLTHAIVCKTAYLCPGPKSNLVSRFQRCQESLAVTDSSRDFNLSRCIGLPVNSVICPITRGCDCRGFCFISFESTLPSDGMIPYCCDVPSKYYCRYD